MYSNPPSFIYGFHGTDKKIAKNIINLKEDIKPSKNSYDWLGHGVYFWENNLDRAFQFAVESGKRKSSKIKTPYALGAFIDLGRCFDLLNQKYIDFLFLAYSEMCELPIEPNKPQPQNSSFHDSDFDFKKRELDCAVIRYALQMAKKEGEEFDTVRAAFWEGELLYDNAGFRKQNHIQIAVLNLDNIKGFFHPRESNKI